MAPPRAPQRTADAPMHRHSVGSLPKSSVQRLTRGRRTPRPVVVATQQMLCRFVQDRVDQSMAVAQHQRRITVTAADVARAARIGMGGSCDGCGRPQPAVRVRPPEHVTPKGRRLVRHRPPMVTDFGTDIDPTAHGVAGAADATANANPDRHSVSDPDPMVVDGGASDPEAVAPPPPPRAPKANRSGGRSPSQGERAGLLAALRRLDAGQVAALDTASAAVPSAVVDAYAECIRIWAHGTVRIQPLAQGRRLATWTPEIGGGAALRGYVLPPGGPVFLPVMDRERCALYVTVPSADPPRMYVATLRGRSPPAAEDGIRSCFEYLVRESQEAGTGGRVVPLACPTTKDAALAGLLLLVAMEAAALYVSLDEWEGEQGPGDLHKRIAADTIRRDVLAGRRGGLRRFLEGLQGETDPAAAVGRHDHAPLMTSDPVLGQAFSGDSASESESEEEEEEAAATASNGPSAVPAEEASVYAADEIDVDVDVVVDDDDNDDDRSGGVNTVDTGPAEVLRALLQPEQPVAEAVVDAYIRFLQTAKPLRTASVYVTQTSTTRRIVDGDLQAVDETRVRDLSRDHVVDTLLLPVISARGARLFVINRFPATVIALGFGAEASALSDGVLAYSDRFTGVRDPGTATVTTTPCSVANAGLYLLLMIEHFVCFVPTNPIVTVDDVKLPDMFPRAEQAGIARRMRHWLHDRLGGPSDDPDARGCYLRAATAVGLGPEAGVRPLLCGWHASNAILQQAGIPQVTTDELDAYAVRAYKKDLKRGAGWSDPSAMPRSDRFYAWIALERMLLERRLTPVSVAPLYEMDPDADDLVGYILADGGHYVAIVPNAKQGGWDLVDDGVHRIAAVADPVALVESFFGRDAATIERDRRNPKRTIIMTYRITNGDPGYRRQRAVVPRTRAAGKGQPAVAPQPAARRGRRGR